METLHHLNVALILTLWLQLMLPITNTAIITSKLAYLSLPAAYITHSLEKHVYK